MSYFSLVHGHRGGEELAEKKNAAGFDGRKIDSSLDLAIPHYFSNSPDSVLSRFGARLHFKR